MALLGMYYGFGLEHINAGELFRTISFRVLGTSGAIIIATAVLMACLSTAIALSAVVAEYVEQELFDKRLGYVTSLVFVLLCSLPLSIAGLTTVLKLTGGLITYVGYPVLIVLTLVNILYKLFNFTWVKLPVAVTFVLVMLLHPEMQEYVHRIIQGCR
jgi:LIVCS family branched-chain amino acid:cation transporter